MFYCPVPGAREGHVKELFGWASAAESSVVLATGLGNAGYFLRRALRNGDGRRLAAALLAALYAGTAALAFALLFGGLDEGPVGVALRAPLVLGNAVTFALIVIGERR